MKWMYIIGAGWSAGSFVWSYLAERKIRRLEETIAELRKAEADREFAEKSTVRLKPVLSMRSIAKKDMAS